MNKFIPLAILLLAAVPIVSRYPKSIGLFCAAALIVGIITFNNPSNDDKDLIA